MMTSYLIFVLSTDWFSPYWSQIGLDLREEIKAAIQRGCRDLVKNVLVKRSTDDEGEFEYLDATEQGEALVQSKFSDLIHGLGIDSQIAAIANSRETWQKNDLSSSMMLSILCQKPTGEHLNDISVPGLEIRRVLSEVCATYDSDLIDFREISANSESEWDKYVQELFEISNTLPDFLYPILQDRRTKAVWNQISARLPSQQREQLLSWYSDVAKSRGYPGDPVPSYVR